MNIRTKLAVTTLAATCVLWAGPAFAANDSPWMVRARAIVVSPDSQGHLSIGGDVDVNSSVAPELDFSYFFSKNWAAELILATTEHDVHHSAAGDLGSAWVLPPTLTVQYHIAPDSDIFRPYVGVGINYSIFYGVDDNPGLRMDYGDSFGLAFQAGFDVPVGNGWSLNADVKKIYMNTDVDLNGAPIGDVDINPWVIGAGVGYRY
ncbi:MAG: OmpW family outer membrane protein [Micropepsaceae bacterium]